MDEEIKTILSDAYEKAVASLQKRRDALDRLAAALLEQEEISGERVLELVGVGS